MIVDFVTGEDWVEIYIDGSRKYCGQSVSPWFMRELILLPVNEIRDWVKENDSDGDLPEHGMSPEAYGLVRNV